MHRALILLLLLPLASPAAPSEKALRYHQLLLKRPQPGTVLERLIDAWLEDSSPGELAKFLKDRAATSTSTTDDQLVLALYLAHEGSDDSSALAAFDAVTKTEPNNITAWIEKARLESRMLDFAKAAASSDAALAQHPEPKVALELTKLRGRMLLRLGRTKDALDAWTALLEAHPNDEELADELIEQKIDEGLYSEAVAQLAPLIERTKDAYSKAARRLQLGDVQLRLAHKPEALAAYADALNQSATGSWIESEALSRIETSFRREDNLKGLAEHLTELTKANPQRLGLQRAHANVLAELGDKDGATKLYQDMIQRSPGDRAMRESFLDLLERFEKYAKAITQTKTLIEQNSKDRELQLRLATLYNKANDKAASATALDSFLKAQNTNEFDHLRVANMLDQWKRIDEAKALFTRTVAAYPKSFEVRDAYAQFLHRNGEKEAAIKVWTELAEGVARDELLAIAMGLIARQEHQPAYELLSKRVAEFGHEPQFLAPLCQAALAVKQAKAAAPWALARVQLSDENNGLPEALAQAIAVLRGADALEQTLNTLKTKAEQNISDLCLLSALYESQGDLAKAEAILLNPTSTIKDAKPRAALQSQLIRLFTGRQEFAKAASAVEQLLTMPDGKTAQNAQRRVDLLNRAGETESAVKAIELWKQLAPAAAQPFLTESQLLRNIGKSDLALNVLRTAQRKFEGDDGISSALADTYAEAGQYAQTERIYLGLYEKASDQTAKLRWVKALADAALLRAETARLITVFKERQRNNSADATPWLALATIYETSEKSSDQLEALQQALHLRPTDVQLAHRIARLQDQSGHSQQALQTLEAIAKQDTTDRTRTQIALTLLGNGETEKAYALFAQIAGANNMDPRDAEMIADTMASNGDWDRMVAFLQPVVTKNPKDYRVGYLLGVAFEELGQAKEAISELMRVLAIRDEMPGFPKGKRSAAYFDKYLEHFDEDYPPGARDFYAASYETYTAYSYHQNRGRGTTTRGGFISLPDEVNTSRNRVAAHLMKLTSSLPSAEREALEQPLKAMQFGGWPIICFAQTEREYGGFRIPNEILKRYPNDLLLHSVWSAEGNDSSPETLELYKQGFNVLKPSYAHLALGKAMMAMLTFPEEGGALFDEALKLKLPPDTRDRASTYWAWSALGSSQNLDRDDRRAGVELPDSRKDQLEAWLLQRHYAMSPEADERSSSFYSAMHGLVKRQKWALLAELIQKEIVTFRGNEKAIKASASQFNYQQSRQGEFLPLPFPPAGTFAPHIGLCLAYPDPYNPDNYGPMKPLAEGKGLLAALDKVSDPQLRIYLAWWAGDSQRAEKEADALLAKPDASQADVLLAAALADRMESHPRMMSLLVRASAMPMSADKRQPLDSAILHAVDEGKDLPADFIEAAKLAARRARSQTSSNKDPVVAVMEKLGMAEEAKRLKQQLASSPKTSKQGSSGFSSSRTNRSQIDKLIASGNLEAAAKELLKGELGNYHSNYFQNNLSYALNNGVRSVNSNYKKLVPTAIKWLEEHKGSSLQKRIEFAAWLDIFGEKDNALAEFKSILEVSPKQDLARCRVITLTLEKDPKAALALLDATPIDRLQPMLESGLYELMRDVLKLEPRAQLLHGFAAIADRLAKDGTPINRKAAPAFAALLSIARQDNRTGGGLGKRMDHREPNSGRVDAKLAALRLEAHEALCNALLKHPTVAPQAFASLTLTRKPEELLPLARQLLKNQTAGDTSLSQSGQNMRAQDRDGQDHLWLPEPAEYLIREAAHHSDLAAIEKDLLPMAEPALSPSQKRRVKAYAKLWLCSEAEFPATASAYLEAAQDNSNYQWWSSANSCVPLDVYTDRKLTLNLDAFMAKTLDEKANWSPPAIIYRYVQNLALRHDPAVTLAFFDVAARKCMGAEQTWDKRIATFVNGYWGGGGGNNDKGAYSMHELLDHLWNQPATMAASLQGAQLTGFVKNSKWRTNTMDTGSFSKLAEDPDSILDLLHIGPFLKPAAEFDAWEISEGQTSMLGSILNTTPKTNESLKKVGATLAKQQPRTFGLDLCNAICAGDGERTKSLTDFIKSHAAEFTLVPEDKRKGVSGLLKKFYPPLKTPNTLDSAMLKNLEPLIGAELKALANRADAIINAKTYKDVIQNDDTEFFESVYKLLGELAKSDPDKAKAVFTRGAELMEAKTEREGFNSAACTAGWTKRSALLGWVAAENKNIEAAAFAHRMFTEDTSGLLIKSGNANGANWGGGLHDAFKNNGGLGNVGRGLKAMLTRLGELMHGASSESLSRAFFEFTSKLSPSLRIPALKWCAKNEHPFAIDLDAGIRLYLLSDPPSVKNEALQKQLAELGGAAPMWKRYTDIITNDKLTPQLRLGVATDVLKRRWHDAPPDLIRTSAKLVAQEHKALHACCGQVNTRWIMRAYCTLPNDEQWKAEVDEQWEAWLVRNAKNNDNPRFERAYLPDDESAGGILHMLARQGNAERIEKILRDTESSQTNEPSAFAYLVEAGAHERAEKWLDQWGLGFLYGYNEEQCWNPVLAAEATKFVASCKKPDLALFGEIVLNQITDAPNPEPGLKSRKDRILALVPKFLAAKFESAEIRQRCLDLICSDNHVADLPELRPEFERCLKTIDLSALAATGNSTITERSTYAPSLALAVQVTDNGDTTATLNLLEKTLALPDNDRSRDKSRARRALINDLFTRIIYRAEDLMAAGKPFHEEAVLKVCDEIARKMPANPDSSSSDPAATRAIIMIMLHHAKTGSLGGFDAWRKTLSPDQLKHCKEQFVRNKNDLWIMTGDLFGKPKITTSVEDRTKLVSALLTNDLVIEMFPATGTNVPNLSAALLTQQKLFKPEEYAPVITKLAAQLPRDGRTANEGGEHLAAHGKVAESLALFDQAATATKDENLKASYLFKKAESQERLNKKPEAIATLKALPKDKLGANNKKTLETMLKRLGGA